MASESAPEPMHVVLDSAVFITASTVPILQRFFAAGSELVTISEVLDEIRDAAARARLQALPFRIATRTPSAEAMAAVARFARETGDLGVLSITDLKVLALVYDLEVQHHGLDRIRSHPKSSRPILPVGRPARRHTPPSSAMPGAGDSRPVNQGSRTSCIEEDGACQVNDEDREVVAIDDNNINVVDGVADDDGDDGVVCNVDDNHADDAEVEVIVDGLEHVALKDAETSPDAGADNDDNNGNGDDDDDDGEWITVGNLHRRQRQPGRRYAPKPALPASSSSTVTCMTTDFAMQNMLVQMGLRLTAMDGRTITNIAQWVLRCCACMKMTLELERVFCPSCGGQALTRSRVKVTSGGWIKYRHSAPKPASLRGTIYSIPKPKGGRKNNDLILREDQLLKVMPKLKKKTPEDLFEQASEFAWRKTTAGVRQQVGHPRGRRVNEPVKKTGKRKQRR